ncbi:MAG: STAS domain-containing protein [Fibromonadaceae bacterium]|jgi:anti-anti-sigma factor|nr:STAS domain-containing protein [Fibromonadaceae bacterium]
MSECVIEDKGGYYQINFDLEVEDFHDIFLKIQEVIKEKKQDMLLSLASIGVLYSSHLATLVRIHQIMHKNNLRFVLSEVSPEIKNLLQITQLDSIFSIYETLDDFKDSLKAAEDKNAKSEMNFEWQILKNNKDEAKIICKGNMVAGEQLDELQKNILDFFNITFDFSELQSMDAISAGFLEKLTFRHSISIMGANDKLIELFHKRAIYEKVKLV